MDANVREQKLKEINTPCGKKEVRYKGETLAMDVYPIPTDCLIFNQYNGRISTFVKTHEKQYGTIDAGTEAGEELITKFLWDSKKDRNRRTMEDIRIKGQLEYGIVTKDGVVIDGNRRCMMLKKLAIEGGAYYFKAAILDETLESNRREIMQLETTFQMGVDDKLDYNPIEKYLKCKDLRGLGFSEKQIADMMNETSPRIIKQYLKTLELLDEYLDYLDEDQGNCRGMYLVLDKESVEGPFVDLQRFLDTHASGKRIRGRDWTPDPEVDLTELKRITFDHIRAGMRTTDDIRYIGDPSKDKGIFSKEEIWKEFSKKHFDPIDEIKDNEPSIEDIRSKNPHEDLVKIIIARNSDFAKRAKSSLKENLQRTKRIIEDRAETDQPENLLRKAQKTLEAIDTDIPAFSGMDIRNLSHEIRKQVEYFIKIIDRKAKKSE